MWTGCDDKENNRDSSFGVESSASVVMSTITLISIGDVYELEFVMFSGSPVFREQTACRYGG